MTLVALLVLGTMGAALADDGVETEEAKEAPLPGIHVPEYDWAADLVAFVFYWGLQDDDPLVECEVAESGPPSTGSFLPIPGLVALPIECVKLNVEGPNGQVNHGSMVSAFVHWLKDKGQTVLSDELVNMPKGQLVKRLAQEDFGKGNFDLLDPDGLTGAEVETEEADGHGPPAWVVDKKAEKAAKGKNK
jgi:hypothetical protein